MFYLHFVLLKKKEISAKMVALEEKTGDSRPQPPQGSLWLVLKQADALDTLLMALGLVGCVADGMAWSANLLILRNIMNSYGGSSSGFTPDDINKVTKNIQLTNFQA